MFSPTNLAYSFLHIVAKKQETSPNSVVVAFSNSNTDEGYSMMQTILMRIVPFHHHQLSLWWILLLTIDDTSPHFFKNCPCTVCVKMNEYSIWGLHISMFIRHATPQNSCRMWNEYGNVQSLNTLVRITSAKQKKHHRERGWRGGGAGESKQAWAAACHMPQPAIRHKLHIIGLAQQIGQVGNLAAPDILIYCHHWQWTMGRSSSPYWYSPCIYDLLIHPSMTYPCTIIYLVMSEFILYVWM